MTTATDIFSPPFQPNPPQDRDGAAMPAGVAAVLFILRTLLRYGWHLFLTLDSRAARRSFAIIAYCFGTAKVPPILARLRRGILRAQALERMLIAHAARGRDLKITPRYTYYDPREPQPDPPPAPEPKAQAARPAPRPRRRAAGDEPPSGEPPTAEQLEAEARRRPVGATLVDICLDFGIRPTMCHPRLWNQLSLALDCYRGSLLKLMGTMHRRAVAYYKEADRDTSLSLPDTSRAGTRAALGFFAGEAPLNPYAPRPGSITAVAAAATGPPSG